MNFKQYLSKDMVKIIDADSKDEALLEIIDLVFKAGKIKNIKKVREGIFYREQLMSTGIGLGIAIPHVRIDSIDNFVIAVGLNSSGIEDYKSIDDIPVKLIILIIGHTEQHKEYIKILSEIVKFLKQDDILKLIFNNVSDLDSLYDILST
jgi:PTS system nitrogen regulatory IIA component